MWERRLLLLPMLSVTNPRAPSCMGTCCLYDYEQKFCTPRLWKPCWCTTTRFSALPLQAASGTHRTSLHHPTAESKKKTINTCNSSSRGQAKRCVAKKNTLTMQYMYFLNAVLILASGVGGPLNLVTGQSCLSKSPPPPHLHTCIKWPYLEMWSERCWSAFTLMVCSGSVLMAMR